MLQILESIWFTEFIKPQGVTGMVKVSSPRRFYEYRQIIQFQCHKYQVATYPPQNYSCEALQTRIKINVSKVSRGPLRSSCGRQIKPCFLLHVRSFCNVWKKFGARWHMSFSVVILYPTFFRGWRAYLNHVIKKESYLSSAFSWHVFLLFINSFHF